MSQISLLKIILKSDVFSCPEARELAKRNLDKKLKRRNKQIIKKTQLKIEL